MKKASTEMPYEELGLRNYFIFGKVMEDRKLCIQMLECLTGNKIEGLTKIVVENSVKITYDSKNVRYDVYVADSMGKIYDAEVQNYRKDIRQQLSLRSRFYQGLIDLSVLEKGMSYSELKESYVIFICTFDPFKKGQGCYFFSNKCHNDSSLSLNDGRAIIFFNTKGDFSTLSETAIEFLSYMETGKVNGVFSAELESAVKSARHNRKWRGEYMKTLVFNNDIRNEGREEGRLEGRLEGAASLIRSCRKLGISDDMILENLISEFGMNKEQAENLLDE